MGPSNALPGGSQPTPQSDPQPDEIRGVFAELMGGDLYGGLEVEFQLSMPNGAVVTASIGFNDGSYLIAIPGASEFFHFHFAPDYTFTGNIYISSETQPDVALISPNDERCPWTSFIVW